jgi:hypothetical protein
LRFEYRRNQEEKGRKKKREKKRVNEKGAYL